MFVCCLTWKNVYEKERERGREGRRWIWCKWASNEEIDWGKWKVNRGQSRKWNWKADAVAERERERNELKMAKGANGVKGQCCCCCCWKKFIEKIQNEKKVEKKEVSLMLKIWIKIVINCEKWKVKGQSWKWRWKLQRNKI